MPQLTKLYRLDVTVEQFLNACSDEEIIELSLLLQSGHYADIITRGVLNLDDEAETVFKTYLQEYADDEKAE